MQSATMRSTLLITTLLLSSCDSEDEGGAARISIVSVPAGVHCIRLSFVGARSMTRSLPVTPGETSTFLLRGLPAGSVDVDAGAFETVCDLVGESSVPTWISDPLTVFLAPGTTTPIMLALRRAASGDVTIDFLEDCGDGIVGAGETCDDGNTSSGDGCSSTCTDEPDFDAGTPSDAGAGETVPLGISFPLAAGDEHGACVVLEAGMATPRQASAIHASLSPGAFVLVVSRTNDPLQPTPMPCTVFSDPTNIMFVAQSANDEIVLPDAAAFAVGPSERLRIGLYGVNATAETMIVSASVAIDLLPAGAPARAETILTIGIDPLINIPAFAATTETSNHTQLVSFRLFAVTTRTHSRGIHASVRYVSPLSDPSGTLIHESFDWSDPPLTMLATPIALDGLDHLELTCEYLNTGATDVFFGESSSDEVCMVFAYAHAPTPMP